MAIKYYCDRCGKEEKKYTTFEISIRTPEFKTVNDWARPDTYVLCRECIDKFDEFLSELGRNKNEEN